MELPAPARQPVLHSQMALPPEEPTDAVCQKRLPFLSKTIAPGATEPTLLGSWHSVVLPVVQVARPARAW